MEYTRTIVWPVKKYTEVERLLNTDAYDGAEIIETVMFDDGYEIDLKLVNGEEGPYLDIVLFDPNGREVTKVDDFALGSTTLRTYENNYTIRVVEGDPE